MNSIWFADSDLPAMKARHGVLGRAAVHPDEGAHEEPEPLRLGRRTAYVIQPAQSALGEHPFEFG